MLKAELQKAYDKIEKDNERLAKCVAAQKERYDEFQIKYWAVGEELEALKDSEHAIRCVRLPHVELENETLKGQVSRLLKRVRTDDLAYKALAGVFKTFIQRTQAADFIWGMRDPTEKRDDW